MLPPELVRKLPFRLRRNFLPWLPPFSKVLQGGLRLLLHFFHKGNHGFPYCRIGEFIKFSICSTRDETLPSCAASAASDPESGDFILVLLLIFGGIL